MNRNTDDNKTMDMKLPILISVTIHLVLIAALGYGLGVGGKTLTGSGVVFVTLTSGPHDSFTDPESGTGETTPGSDRVAASKMIDQEVISGGEEEELENESREHTQPETESTALPAVNGGPENREPENGEPESTVIQQISADAEPPPNPGTRLASLTAVEGGDLSAGLLSSGINSGSTGIFVPASTVSLPRPPYPVASRRLGEEGTVTLAFLVGPDGRVDNITVMESSGYYRLDRAARASLSSVRFAPATEYGVPVAMSRMMAFSFRLKD